MASKGAHGTTTAIVFLAVLGLVTACGSGGGEEDAGPSDGGAGDSDGGAASSDAELVFDGEVIADEELWSAAQEEGRFVYYAAQPEATSAAILERFTEDTGIEAELVRLSGGRLQERILSEIAGDELGADVIQLSDLSSVLDLKDEGAYQEHRVPSEDMLAQEARDPDGEYTPFYNAAMAMAYHTVLVEEDDVPDSWADLLDSQWADALGLFDIGVGGSSWSLALFHRQVLGEDFWGQLAGQSPLIYSGNAPLVEALTRGEILVGTASPGFVLRQKASGAPIDVIFPEEGFATFPSFLGLANGAENANAGKVFMNWATSLHGQNAIGSITGDYMAHEDAAPPVVDGVEFPAEIPWSPSPQDWVDLREEWSSDYRATFGEASD